MEEQKFQTACQQVKSFTKRPPKSDMLELYSLYKQAIFGDVNTSKPFDAKGKSKWEAWNGKKGLDQMEAKEKYVEFAKNLSSKYE